MTIKQRIQRLEQQTQDVEDQHPGYISIPLETLAELEASHPDALNQYLQDAGVPAGVKIYSGFDPDIDW